MNQKTGRKLLGFLLSLVLVLGLMPGMSMTAYADSEIFGSFIEVFDSASGTINSDMTCTYFEVFDKSTLTINQGVTVTLNNPDIFDLSDNSKIELHGTLTGSAGSRANWMMYSYINVYLSDGAKYTVTGLSCMDGDNYLVYYGYDAATDGNGTVSVKNGSTDVTSASKGDKTTTYTFTATPNSGYKFVNWTKGAGGEVLGTDASINVTCEQNGQYQVYANFESDKTAQTITAADVTVTYGDTGKSISGTTSGDGAISYSVKSGDAVNVDSTTGALTIVKAGSAVITVAAAETATYAQATKDVNVTVNTKAMTVTAADVNVAVDGQPHGITVNVTDPASGATVKYGTEAGTYNLDASPTQTEAGELTVYYQVTADNYTTYTGSAKVTVNAKQTQTITASDVTATYGDTGKSVSGTTTGDGAISYSVKSGDAVTVDENTGALTIKKVGTATVIVTAAETATYEQATKEVTVTINKADPTVTAPTAKTLTYNGSAQELVTEGTATGGTMYYAVTTENAAPTDDNLYTTSIPTATDAGTYTVWYKVVGDANHNDADVGNVSVTIGKADSSATAPTALNLKYTGSAQALVEAGSATGGTMQYSLDGQTYSAEIPTGTEPGDYTVYYKVVGDSNHKDTDAAKIIITISAADTSPAAPGTATYTVTPGSALTYNGEAQALVTGGSVEGGELQYALGSDAETVPEDAAFSAEIPIGTNAGTYFVWYRVVGDANHNDVAPVCLPVTIDKAAIAPTVTITGWTYGEAANAPSVEGNSGNGEVRCEYSDAKDGTYTDVVPSEPGTYFVRAIIAETENYLGATTEPLSFAIARASEPTPVEPDAPATPVAAAKDILIATMVSESDTALKLTWPSQDGVDGYDVFFRKCSSGKDFPLLASLDGANATSYTVTGLLKETSYKAYVKAWVMGNGGKKYVATSPEVHAFTANGTKSISNPGTLTAPDSVSVKLTKTAQIKAKVKGIKKGKLANHVKNLRYISDNTAVVTVTTSGKIKAVGAGSCKVYVLTTNGIWKAVTVNVDASPTKIKINGAKRTMEIGATQALGGKVKLTPTAAVTTVSWSSSDPTVATVDANGVVTALSKGKAVITATTDNGKKAKVTIKVK